MNDTHRPTEPVGEAKEPQGFAGIARHLNELHPDRRRPISRQLVYKWYICRRTNRFPEPVATSGGGSGHSVWDLETVATWYEKWSYYHGTSVTRRPAPAPVHTISTPTEEEGGIAA